MRGFIQTHLDPVDRLGEVVFGLIMALGVIGAIRLEAPESDNHSMLIGVLGCNIAWAVVDGVMFASGVLFERGLRARLVQRVKTSETDEIALEHVARHFDDQLSFLTTPQQRRQIYTDMVAAAKRASSAPATLSRKDILGGLAVAILVVAATLPVVVPFLMVPNPLMAARSASGVALVLLFLTGSWWARMVNVSWLRFGAGLTFIGLLLAVLAIALGG